jgi:hypothetical protein
MISNDLRGIFREDNGSNVEQKGTKKNKRTGGTEITEEALRIA